ncbi:MAG TPA: hypothetical protein VMU04_01520 [Candidatus Acidoferrum sp.]|nr:hypothetical protein [Candidatus Acidoferrum sp.]
MSTAINISIATSVVRFIATPLPRLFILLDDAPLLTVKTNSLSSRRKFDLKLVRVINRLRRVTVLVCQPQNVVTNFKGRGLVADLPAQCLSKDIINVQLALAHVAAAPFWGVLTSFHFIYSASTTIASRKQVTVVGHATSNITDDVYSDAPAMERLRAYIESVKLPTPRSHSEPPTDSPQPCRYHPATKASH